MLEGTEEEWNPITLRRKNKNATIDFHLKIWFSRNDMFILAKESKVSYSDKVGFKFLQNVVNFREMLLFPYRQEI